VELVSEANVSGIGHRYDRARFLDGPQRNQVLTLADVRRHGTDRFGDEGYVRLYGMSPAQWYEAGVRLLGRTTVEFTRDELADAVGGDVAALAAVMAPGARLARHDGLVSDRPSQSPNARPLRQPVGGTSPR
jgi:hypothetical protein